MPIAHGERSHRSLLSTTDKAARVGTGELFTATDSWEALQAAAAGCKGRAALSIPTPPWRPVKEF